MSLKNIRRILALVFIAGITLLFLLPSKEVGGILGWMADIQFLPAVLSLNLVVIVALVLLTLVFGRIYCSVICPLGVFQDLVARLRPKRKYKWKKETKWLRYGVLALYVAAILAGVHAVVVLLAPYSAYGRMVEAVHGGGAAAIAVAVGTFLIVGTLAFLGGRTWCNSICPVGTTLSFFSRFALLRPYIDADKCKNCHKCEHVCKASCIDLSTHSIDHSRCLTCFNCIDSCKFGALTYKVKPVSPVCPVSPAREAGGEKEKRFFPTFFRREKVFSFSRRDKTDGIKEELKERKEVEEGRRAFIIGSAVAAGAALSQQDLLASTLTRKAPTRTTHITPPGSISAANMASRCTGCQLCVSKCPNNVLRPSVNPERFMQPELSYEKGFCRPECTACGDVCPTGAIKPFTREEKSSIQAGHAVWVHFKCLPATEGVKCGNCARHCPSGAIYMVHMDPQDPASPLIPSVDESRCIGCGACEYLCPTQAIYVEGNSVHREI